MKTLRPCEYFGCKALVSRGRYCDNHLRPRENKADKERGSSHSRGYTRTWGKLRSIFLADNPLCAECGEPAAHVHHVKSLRSGGELLDRENLQSLCVVCHGVKTRRGE